MRVLAIHGLTGHGKRWQTLATRHLPEITLAAPDLLGHGRSSWAAPWTFDANVTALAELAQEAADGPVLVVGHSFGGAVALHLAATRPDLWQRWCYSIRRSAWTVRGCARSPTR
jgi:lipase